MGHETYHGHLESVFYWNRFHYFIYIIPLNISDPESILCCFRLHFLMWISQDADMAALCVVDFSTCAKRSRRIKLCRGTAVELRYWTPWRWATTTEVRGHFWKKYTAGGFVHTEHLPCSAMRSVPVCDTMCDSWIFCALSCYFSTVGYAEGQPCLYCDIHHEQVLNSEQNVLCMVTRSCNICTVDAFEVWQSRASPCQAPSKVRGAINNLCMWTMVSPYPHLETAGAPRGVGAGHGGRVIQLHFFLGLKDTSESEVGILKVMDGIWWSTVDLNGPKWIYVDLNGSKWI